MKANELARRLDGMDLSDIPIEMNSTAKRAGLVVVIGTSKNMIQFYGAIEDQIDMEDGGPIHLDADGILPESDEIERYEDEQRAYYDRKRMSYLIDAEWGVHGFPWSFTTAIPHHRFMVANEGARYCRGIVFDKAAIGGGA